MLGIPAFVTVVNADDCLRYEPEVVTLTGKLEQRTSKDEPKETHFYLVLARAVCTTGEKAGPSNPDAYPVKNVRLVQLALDADGYKRLRPNLGRQVTLRGTLLAAHTVHHHAPLLLMVKG